MSEEAGAVTDRIRLAELLGEFNALETRGAAARNHPDHERRNELLDDLQDAAGLGGRMVMERDILKHAALLLKDR